MRYAIVDEKKAAAKGFKSALHRTRKGRMVLNEREIELSVNLSGSAAERVADLGGRMYENAASTMLALAEIG